MKEDLFTGSGVTFICPALSGSCAQGLGDNQGSIALAENPLSSAQIKYTDVRFHFGRELLRAETMGVQFVASEEQHADILTKSLATTSFKYHRKFLLNLPLENE